MGSDRAALWIVERLGTDPALAGDLAEQRAAGRSRSWVWRQAAGAVAAATAADAIDHPWWATGAVLLALLARAASTAFWGAFGLRVNMAAGAMLVSAAAPSHRLLLVAVGAADTLITVPLWAAAACVARGGGRRLPLLFGAATLALLFPGEARQLGHVMGGLAPPGVGLVLVVNMLVENAAIATTVSAAALLA